MTKPRVLALDPAAPTAAAVAAVRAVLDRGGVAAVPTDTVYGLAANALDPAAVRRVFALKGRDFHKPLPVVVGGRAQAAALAASLPPLFERLAAAFWPGPLTLLVAAAPSLPPELTAGSGAIAMRQPGLPFLLELLAACGYPLTATSANRSGEPECLTPAAVANQLGDALAALPDSLLVDAGPALRHQPSTILDLTVTPPAILRPGAVPAAALAPYL